MLTVKELIELKARVLLAAEAAHQIVGLEGAPLELDEQTYSLVMDAMHRLREDARALLAEVDILRGMATGQFDHLFQGGTEHGRSADVGGVQPQEVAASGEGERAESAEASGPVRPSGSDGEEASGPKPKRNRRTRRSDQKEVDAGG